MDREKRSGQASFANDTGNALHQSFVDLTFFIGNDHSDHSVDKKIGEKNEIKIGFISSFTDNIQIPITLYAFTNS
jgi:hypothetical protein